jgi:hypothetical protein
MWFAQAEAQFRRSRITAETTMYDYILMKLPQDVVMSVRALVSAIEADPVKQETSYTLMKEALLGSYGMTKWQMAYALLDHPDLGDRRPSAMMAEMLSLRYETTAPDSLFLALFLRRLPPSIREHLSAANHTTALPPRRGRPPAAAVKQTVARHKLSVSRQQKRVSFADPVATSLPPTPLRPPPAPPDRAARLRRSTPRPARYTA